MLIIFDNAKCQTNIKERGLDFARVEAFDFSTAHIEQDTRKNYPEMRFVAIGYLDERLHVLCFTPIQTGDNTNGIRVISFRKANLREVKHYEQTL